MYRQNVFASLVAQLKATQYSETVKSSSIVFEWQSHKGLVVKFAAFSKARKRGGDQRRKSWTATVSLDYEQDLAFDTTFI